jgi:hypothetical protein
MAYEAVPIKDGGVGSAHPVAAAAQSHYLSKPVKARAGDEHGSP